MKMPTELPSAQERIPTVRAKTEVLELLKDFLHTGNLLVYCNVGGHNPKFPEEVLRDSDVVREAKFSILRMGQFIGIMDQPDRKSHKDFASDKLKLVELAQVLVAKLFKVKDALIDFRPVYQSVRDRQGVSRTKVSQDQLDQIERLRVEDKIKVYQSIVHWLLADEMRYMSNELLAMIIDPYLSPSMESGSHAISGHPTQEDEDQRREQFQRDSMDFGQAGLAEGIKKFNEALARSNPPSS